MLTGSSKEIYDEVKAESFSQVPGDEIEEEFLGSSGERLVFDYDSMRVSINFLNGEMEYAMVNLDTQEVRDYDAVSERLEPHNLNPTVIDAGEFDVAVSGVFSYGDASPEEVAKSLDDLYREIDQL